MPHPQAVERVMRSPESPPSRAARALVFVRHQASASAATAVDFGTMIVLVSLAGVPAVVGTVIGATCGAVTNFLLARAWVFSAREGRVHSQASRYALVSGGSLLWNAGGEYLLHDIARIQYVLARAMVAVAVSFFWNYPMHRAYVFRAGGP
jgi:putative flippase GtrA